MMKRVYQLGENTCLVSKEINAFIRAEEYIKITKGENYWDKEYKHICNIIRKKFNFNYLIALAIPKNSANKEDVIVFVFEADANEKTYDSKYDEEKDLNYIEIDTDN